MDSLLEMKDITMKFGNFVANDHVNFSCEQGSVISLLGENGAGKTTLMKVIYGMNIPQGGEIFFQGKKVSIQSPRDAIGLGIQMVHQHFMLVNHLTVAENVVMGAEPKKFGLFQQKAAEDAVRKLSQAYGLHVDPAQRVEELSVGAKQRTEIIKALYHGAKLLILDEPTAVLTPQESEDLFKIIRKLKEDGKSVIIITHKLHETMEIADMIYVLRHGRMTGRVRKEDTNPDELTRLMVDHELASFEKLPRETGKTLLLTKDVRLRDADGVPVLSGVNLDIHSGEIYGIAGIEGNGQQELVEVLSGIKKGWSGEARLLDVDIRHKTVREITECGVACIHSDRQDRGLLMELDTVANVLLGYQYSGCFRTKQGFIKWKKTEEITREIFEKYEVSPKNTASPVGSFSGGNQQKIIVGREFYRTPRLAIVAYPTRGVDIGVSEIIHQSILTLRSLGSAVLLITADFDELFKLSDRVGVLYEGRIVIEGDACEFTPNRLGYYMGGGDQNAEI